MQSSSFLRLFVLGACLLAVLSIFAAPHTATAHPIDLYDDVSDFFDAVSLDQVLLPGRSAPETFCRMPVRKGVCRALIPRFSYDPQRKDCIEFKFGGCDGNENNFSSYEACMATCEGM